MNNRIFVIFFSFFIFAATFSANASGETKKGFNAGEVIIDHIVDAHDWHLFTVGEKHVSIPLPIILLNEGKLHCFLSSKFHHGEHTYNGFKLETKGENKGKIICVDEAGVFTGKKPWDFSITKTVLSVMITATLIFLILMLVVRSCKKRENKAPKGMQSLVEMLVIFIRDDIARSSISEKKVDKFLPFLLTIFIFIFINNLMGLVPLFPGGVNVTGNIGVTFVLAIFTFLVTTFNGNKHYWADIFNTPGVPWWLKFPLPLMPVVEVLSMFTKPLVLMIRLFANMTAGHIIVLGFICIIFIFGNISAGWAYGTSIVPIIFSLFISLLELLVSFIQAYVFTLLSALYIGMATVEHETSHK